MRKEQVKALLEGYRRCAARRASLAAEMDLAKRERTPGYAPRWMETAGADLGRMADEWQECDAACRCVEAWLGALNARERLVIDMQVIGGESYEAVLDAFAERFPASAVTSREGIRQVKRRAMEKMAAAAGAG